MLSRKYFPALPFYLMVMGQGLFSQIILQGTVRDNGAEFLGNGSEPVENVLVTLTDQTDTTRTFNDYTNEQGEYSIEIDGTGVYHSDSQNPGAFILFQNYPNPFNPSTVISYELSRPALVRIDIHNLLGRKVRTLFDGFQSNQTCQVIWDGTDDRGQGVPAGVYIYSLRTEERSLHRKMLLIDGGQSVSKEILTSGMGKEASGQHTLTKISSDVYSLKVTGDNIKVYEQQDLAITDNTVLDITVYRTVKDIDGNVYKTIKISNQWWMMENLKVTRFRNGDEIPYVVDNTEWMDLTTGGRCVYDHNSSNAEIYGLLYNWYALNDNRNITPEGWHVPSDTEWQILVDYLGGSYVAGGKLKESGTLHWNSPNTGATNESGFTALPGGWRCSCSGGFSFLGLNTYFWTSTELDASVALLRELYFVSSEIYPNNIYKQYGFSVRCVRD